MKKVIFLVTIVVVFSLICLSGCTDQEKKDTIPIFKKQIVGTWFNQGTMENETYAIVYEFYSNMSFYTAFIDFKNSIAVNAIRGTYDLDNDTLYFYDTTLPLLNSTLKYVFEDDYLNILIYYPDYPDPIVFAKDLNNE